MPAHLSRPFAALALFGALAAGPAHAQAESSKQLAPGFTTRAASSQLLVLPADMELFSISAGGVQEPRADWTESAQKHFAQALQQRRARLGRNIAELPLAQAEAFSDLTALHRAVADAIYMHHSRGGSMKLPTKAGQLDWSLGDAVRPLREKTGADYALFTWIRDSYASSERKAVMLGMALLGSLTLGGEQVGYASLVDLKTGRIVWFNELGRLWGDLRDEQSALETVDALLTGFPEAK